MGGRGAWSYSASGSRDRLRSDKPLSAYAVAALNTGIAGGTTSEAAVERFREQLMDERNEFSAYIDDAGFVHSLGSSGKGGSTAVASLFTVAHERGVSTVIHNHPFGGSDGRKWGGPLSEGDLMFISNAFERSGGKVNKMVATAREGTYTATVTRRVSHAEFAAAAGRAENALKGRKFRSEWAMWEATNAAYASEFAKIGINIKFDGQPTRRKKLVTKKTGTY